jgi:hypothetical protein
MRAFLKVISIIIFSLSSKGLAGILQTTIEAKSERFSLNHFDCAYNSAQGAIQFWSMDLQTVLSTTQLNLKIFSKKDGEIQRIMFEDKQTQQPAFFADKEVEEINAHQLGVRFLPLQFKHVKKTDSWGFPLSGLQLKIQDSVILQAKCVAVKKIVGSLGQAYSSEGTSYGKTKAGNAKASVSGLVAAEVCESEQMEGFIHLPDRGFGEHKGFVKCQFVDQETDIILDPNQDAVETVRANINEITKD